MTRREWAQWLAGAAASAAIAREADPSGKPGGPPALRWFHTVADDFVVDIWHNGVLLPDSCRELQEDAYGAAAEKVTRDVRPGDWLAFHVVNNRLRWGGVKYFGFVGFAAAGDPALVSEAETGRWTCCEEPGQVPAFLAKATSPADRPAKAIDARWEGGDPRMHAAAGGQWRGTPIWGAAARSLWLKVRIPG